MKQCLRCQGLVPASLSACPNCAVAPRSSGLKKLVGFVALVGATAISCVPVYGAPCALRQVDGGRNGCFGQCDTLLDDGGSPEKDPQSECFVPDGGTP
jgi:hypothetical protein